VATKPSKKPAPVPAESKILVHRDRQRYTCIEVSRTATAVSYLIIEPGEGVHLKKTAKEVFEARFVPVDDYPGDKAIQHFREFASRLGATPEAVEVIGQICKTDPKELIMATATKAAPAKRSNAKPAATKAVPKKETKATPVKAEKKAAGGKYASAAAMFQGLIMAGGKTVDQIFAAVQKEFGLPDNKKSYVKWYHNNLAKQGKNPPPLKD